MTLKNLFAIALGSLMLITAGHSLADRDDRRGYRGDHRAEYRGDKGWQHPRKRYSTHGYRHQKWRNEHRRHWRHHRGRGVRINHGYRYRPDYTGIIGGALIGSAITHSLHDTFDGGRARGRAGTVSGCYRLERLGGGRERRVDLPLSWCH
ncbi:hypothetical protein [Chromatocurvus halotolerans]|uniref:Glycine zipper 2TM protein n=1 Tax=Chromatocurvus halotolerans TaxID=1132028 RepID=A0A4R2KR05_9GAMM|nr:hypothetical protein [Chromatocurvus halotolerans]TCO76711.1 hypothetical protein EV688_104165 [Chromatocurvus halotolerans]